MKTLVSDFREIMYPYTSMNLRENDKTTMKDYMKAAGYYQMSHMVIFTATKKSAYLRFIKNPGGPTITFKILGYSNRKDVLAV
jgi:ribosome biogenesis protein SSF1/2